MLSDRLYAASTTGPCKQSPFGHVALCHVGLSSQGRPVWVFLGVQGLAEMYSVQVTSSLEPDRHVAPRNERGARRPCEGESRRNL